ncbi:MAG: hypothetical protein N2Z65_00580 [Clostridiales bacterium]|nr:hypothetical protein [Clostridiales bacterium]
MNANLQMLNYIHQNSQMGQETLNQLIKINKDPEFETVLSIQYNEYKHIFDSSEQKISTLGGDVKNANPYKKVSSYLASNLGTLIDKSPSHISEMLIRGSTMGVIDITKNLKEYQDADPDVLALGQQLLSFEQQNIEECKRFLQ